MRSIVISAAILFGATSVNAQAVSNSLPKERGQLLGIYRLTFQPDSTEIQRKSELMRLTIGKTISSFESMGSYLADSVTTTMGNEAESESGIQAYVDKLTALPHSRFDFKIYKNLPANIIYSYDEVDGKMYCYPEKFSSKNWKLSVEKSKIAGYNCQKATVDFAGRHFEAWFTREIPVADGPYKFYGLPGLIIKLNDTRKQYAFELVGLKKVQQGNFITLPKQAILTTKAAVQKGKRNYYNNLSATTLALTSKTAPSAEAKENERKRISKKFNNSLDLR